jgi:hypothetical protein
MTLTGASVKGKTPVGVCNYGCIPDRNAYTLEEKTAPGNHYHNQKRYIGGHIHYSLHGFPTPTTRNSYITGPYKPPVYGPEWDEVVGAAHTLVWDAFVGVPMVAMLGNANDYGEALRRTYYGQAGSHRVKTYGVEYRVLSGALMMSPFLLGWALGAIRQTVKRNELLKDFKPDVAAQPVRNANGQYIPPRAMADTHEQVTEIVKGWFKQRNLRLHDVKEIINSHDVKAARDYVREHKNEIYNYQFVDLMMKADKKGIKLVTDIFHAWNLSARIANHSYIGVEGLMQGNKVNKEQFKAISLIKPKGWSKLV